MLKKSECGRNFILIFVITTNPQLKEKYSQFNLLILYETMPLYDNN